MLPSRAHTHARIYTYELICLIIHVNYEFHHSNSSLLPSTAKKNLYKFKINSFVI